MIRKQQKQQKKKMSQYIYSAVRTSEKQKLCTPVVQVNKKKDEKERKEGRNEMSNWPNVE